MRAVTRLFPILVWVLLSHGLVFAQQDEELRLRADGLRYMPNQSKPYTGKAARAHFDGTKISEINYRAGKQHGAPNHCPARSLAPAASAPSLQAAAWRWRSGPSTPRSTACRRSSGRRSAGRRASRLGATSAPARSSDWPARPRRRTAPTSRRAAALPLPCVAPLARASCSVGGAGRGVQGVGAGGRRDRARTARATAAGAPHTIWHRARAGRRDSVVPRQARAELVGAA